MLVENGVFVIREAEKQLYDSRKQGGKCVLTPDNIDFEMQCYHSDTELRLNFLTQAGLEHFVTHYGKSYKTLVLDYCAQIKDFSPLADLPDLEAIRIDWCRNVSQLWDLSKNPSLRVISLHNAKRIVENPLQLRQSSSLEEIRLWGGGWDTKHTLSSMDCFSDMKTLKRIDLNNIKLKSRDFSILDTLPELEEFHFDAGMLTTEEIAWICARYPHIYGDCLGPYTHNEVGCLNDVRVCGHRKPGLDLPADQERLDRYIAEFDALVEKYRHEVK